MPQLENGNHVSLREFVERVITEHDRINLMRLESARQDIQALRATMAAYEKSSERAVEVSRNAQQKVSEKANEFRQSLDDANKNNLSRTEAESRFVSANARLDEVSKQIAAAQLLMSNFLPIKDYEKGRDEIRFEISSLRESRSVGIGQAGQSDKNTVGERWAIGAGLVIVGIVLSATVIVLRLLGL